MKRKTKKILEKDIQNQIIKAMNRLNFCVWRSNSGLIFLGKGRGAIRLAPAGTPDICGYDHLGRFVAVECKLPGKKLRPKQVEWIEEAEACGVRVCVAHSVQEALEFFDVKASKLMLEHARIVA